MSSSPATRRWSSIVAAHERSGLSVREFARDRGLNANTLAWWRWELSRRAQAAGPSFVELSVVQPVDEATPAVSEGIDLVLDAVAARVTVTSLTDLGLLRRLLEALC